ncbi:Protein ELF4-LIKE 4 [Dichanthelium oligosanthes]|uniref:Protein ELF4-LIKE 4 n=1 Tax=Dichanthelium oligosanthes TaxID=888268 RepID=A0A1E5UNI3_9POAL|nr:Protein ELF4-LIKE 4 [Dichanthelium oligosanthes]
MDGDSYSGMANGVGVGGGGQAVDGKLIQTFHKSFVQVQNLLDQNRMLITEINQNHESRAPGNLTRNVGLIRELNNNIRRVVGLYADLSASFTRNSMDASSDGDSSGTLRSPDGRAGQKRVRPG